MSAPQFVLQARRSACGFLWAATFLLLFLSASTSALRAAATLRQQIDPPEVSVGDQVSVVFTIQNGSEATIDLPHVDGLQMEGNSSSTQITFSNGTLMSASSQTFTLLAMRPGDITIPAFDIHMQSGEVLHAQAMKVHVLNGNSPVQTNPSVPPANGPVIMPPNAGQPGVPTPPDGTDNASAPEVRVPVDSNGQPVKVFMDITAKTTDTYVGGTIPLRIEFYIRMDSMAPQNSLPTINGSDFLMNDLSPRPTQDEIVLMQQPYHRETWLTAIAAPRSGDFPLEMARDTYWLRNPQNIFADPLGSFFGGRSSLVHANIPSNKLVIHARPLPSEGRPANFTGAIGDFKATGLASPSTVKVGDPAYLDFSVTGEGNFDSVRCPVLAPNPAWKSYGATSQVHYVDESHTNGEKDFRQAIIPQKNGTLQLPVANFSYFDPTAKQYVTIPISLPALTVTGTSLPVSIPAAAPNASSTIAITPPSDTGYRGNRLEFGELHTTLKPAYSELWFWLPQVGLILLAMAAVVGFSLRSQMGRDHVRIQSLLRHRSLQELEGEMSTAAAAGDAATFFRAAKRAIQLRWSSELRVPPDAVTITTLHQHDPHLGEAAAPIFERADEIHYSGQAAGEDLDLKEWEQSARELLRPVQPA